MQSEELDRRDEQRHSEMMAMIALLNDIIKSLPLPPKEPTDAE